MLQNCLAHITGGFQNCNKQDSFVKLSVEMKAPWNLLQLMLSKDPVTMIAQQCATELIARSLV